jgi:hypothetical protein
MDQYVSLSLTSTKSCVHLHALYSLRTALKSFTPRRDQLVIYGQYRDCRGDDDDDDDDEAER